MWLVGAEAAAATLTGAVRAGGGGVAGVEVVAVGLGGAAVSTRTDADGRYTVEVGPGVWRVRAVPAGAVDLVPAWAPGVLDACAAARLEADGDDEVLVADVALDPGARLRGQVLDPDGVPLAGATVTVSTTDSFPNPRAATTGADGRFAVGGVIPGEAVVVFTADGLPLQFLGGFAAVPVALAAGAELDLGPVTLRPGVTLGGAVRAGGAPAGEGLVSVQIGAVVEQAPIGPDGRWTVAGLPPGDAAVWAAVPGFATTYLGDLDRPAQAVPVADGEVHEDLDLALPPEAVVRGRLRADGVVDWTGATVAVHDVDRAIEIAVAPAPDGAFVIGGLWGGAYGVTVNGAGAGAVDAEWRDEAGAPVQIDVPPGGEVDVGAVEVPPGASLSGVVSDDAGRPVAGAVIVASSFEDGVPRFASTPPSGVYRIAGLPEAPYEVVVRIDRQCPADGGYVPLWFPETPNPDLAAPLGLARGEPAVWDVVAPPDHDRDGMDDRWERREGLSVGVDDAERDPDEDGYDNLREYLLGTDPHGAVAGCGCGGGGGRPLGALGAATIVVGRRRQPKRAAKAR